MKTDYETIFFKFLNEELDLHKLEQWICKTPDLENDMGSDLYSILVDFNFKDKYASTELYELILRNIVDEGEFLTWKIKELLVRFIDSPSETQILLEKFYFLSANAHNSQGDILKGFKFLQNLGLNYIHWMEEGYLKTNFGKKWQHEYEKCKNELPFYHLQLVPIAKKILLALSDKQIEIRQHGEYTITDVLRGELESENILKLERKADD